MGLARDVEKQLREAGHSYTSRAVEGMGGYTRAEFVVEAPRQKVHISTGYSSDAQVLVQSIERAEIEYKPLSQRRCYIIVGLDPGTTTGIAALNLSGELVDLISSRAMSSSEVIEWIAARGRPLLVATDVYPTPGAVEKVKRAFSAVLFSPGADIPAEEKIALGREFGYRNDHERDALAAAASAFKKYRNKFLQVERKVPEDLDPDEVKALVVRGFSIENAVSELLTPEASQLAKPPAGQAEADLAEASPDVAALRQHNQMLSEQVRTLRSYVDDLKAGLGEKDAALAAISGKLDRLQDRNAREIKRQHEIRIRDKEIERLRSLLRSERKHIKKLKRSLARQKKAEAIEDTRGLLQLKPLSAFSKEAVLLAAEQFGLEKGDLIFLENASGGGRSTIEHLSERGVAGVVAGEEMAPAQRELFFDLGIPVYSGRSLKVQRINNLPFIRPEDLAAARAAWEEEMVARRARLEAERLESLFQEYRVERKKEEKRAQKLDSVTKAKTTLE
jgi:predicted RNase H-like nuclease (RuvC/YqgF family)